VIHIRGSSNRTAKFIKFTEKMISMNNRTKWNSWYAIFIIFLKLKIQVETYCLAHEDEFKKDILFSKN
jgi:hypothetical protein